MILLLGGSGYIGSAFVRELKNRNSPFVSLSRKEIDYTRFDALSGFLQQRKPEFVINAAGYTGKPNVDACETHKADTLQGNALFPATVAHACAAAGIPWGHVSSGCIYNGAKVVEGVNCRVEKDLTTPEARQLIETKPAALHGFSETDAPNFSFRDGPCSFYSGSKALGEEAILDVGQGYIWRLRIPFDEFDSSRNYLSKVQRYPKVYDNANSITHRGEFARVCLDMWKQRVPFGTYNVTNPGFVTTRQVIGLIERILRPHKTFEFFPSDAEFYGQAASTPRSNCILDVSKLLATGVKIRPVHEAIETSLKHWKPEQPSTINSQL